MANAIVRLAKEFVVIVNNMVIARCTDFSLSINKETIDISSFDSNGFKEYIGDMKDWSISFGSMVTRDYGSGCPTGVTGSGVFNNLFDHLVSTENDYPCAIGLGDPDAPTGNYFSGKGILNDLSFDGAVGDKMTYSGGVKGSGTLSRT